MTEEITTLRVQSELKEISGPTQYYFDAAQECLRRGDMDNYIRWMFKHDDAVRGDY